MAIVCFKVLSLYLLVETKESYANLLADSRSANLHTMMLSNFLHSIFVNYIIMYFHGFFTHITEIQL